jgi:hypothetical protein
MIFDTLLIVCLVNSVIPSVAWTLNHHGGFVLRQNNIQCAFMGPRLLHPTSGRIKSRLSPCTRMASASATAPAQISIKKNDFEDIMSTIPYKAQDAPDTFTDIDGETLRRDGLATFSVDLHDVEDVARMYRRLRLEHSGFRRCRPSAAPTSRLGARANIVWTEEIPFRTEASGFRLAVPATEGEEALAFEVYTTGKAPSPCAGRICPACTCARAQTQANTSATTHNTQHTIHNTHHTPHTTHHTPHTTHTPHNTHHTPHTTHTPHNTPHTPHTTHTTHNTHTRTHARTHAHGQAGRRRCGGWLPGTRRRWPPWAAGWAGG